MISQNDLDEMTGQGNEPKGLVPFHSSPHVLCGTEPSAAGPHCLSAAADQCVDEVRCHPMSICPSAPQPEGQEGGPRF